MPLRSFDYAQHKLRSGQAPHIHSSIHIGAGVRSLGKSYGGQDLTRRAIFGYNYGEYPLGVYHITDAKSCQGQAYLMQSGANIQIDQGLCRACRKCLAQGLQGQGYRPGRRRRITPN